MTVSAAYGVTRTGLVGNQASYNNYNLGPECRTLSVDILPVLDASGRIAIYNQYTIVLEFPVAGSTAAITQAIIADIRRKLTKPGGAFIYRGREVGDLVINTNTVKDVKHGPIPGQLGIKLSGSGNAAKITFPITVCLPDCIEARFKSAPMELSYEIGYDIDRNGLTTRSVSGVLKIANNRAFPGAQISNDSADRLREQIEMPWLDGFRRVPGRFTLSRDRSELSFSFTDEEFEGPAFPEGCLDANASHSIQNNGPLNFSQWSGQIEAEYRIAKNADPELVKEAFKLLVEERLKFHRQQVDSKTVLPVSYSVSRPNLYGPNITRFNFTYQLIVKNGLEKILGVSGLWNPVPGTDWGKWYTSVKNILGVRGTAQLTFNPNEEKYVDLCEPSIVMRRTQSTQQRPDDDGDEMPIKFDPPKPKNSWLRYEIWLEYQTDQGVVAYRSLPKADIEPESSPPTPDSVASPLDQLLNMVPPGVYTQGGAAAQALLGLIGNSGGGYALPPNPIPFGLQPEANPAAGNNAGLTGPGGISGRLIADTPATKPPKVNVQQRTSPMTYVWLCGKGLRAGYPVPKPELEDMNGVKPIACNREDCGEGFHYGQYAQSHVPIFWAVWRERYLLPELPDGKIPMPKNPTFDS